MNRLAVIADRVAKSVTAGILVGVKGFAPKDIFWVETRFSEGMRDFGRNVRVTEDGRTSALEFTGTINIYVVDESLVKLVLSRADDIMTHLGHIFKIIGRVRQDVSQMTKQAVIRVEIQQNPDEEFSELIETSITYSTWRSILDWLGFNDVNEEHGSMQISDYLHSYFKPGDFEGKQKEAVFARQIAVMGKAAMKRGYKEISWA